MPVEPNDELRLEIVTGAGVEPGRCADPNVDGCGVDPGKSIAVVVGAALAYVTYGPIEEGVSKESVYPAQYPQESQTYSLGPPC